MTAHERKVDDADFQSSLDFLANTPNRFAKLTEGFSNAELRVRDEAGSFSVVENVCHLRDLEVQGYAERIRRMLDEENPSLADFDGARVAAMSDYNSQNIDEALVAFESARRANVETLRGATEAQRNRTGTLEGVGTITLNKLVEMMREHDEGHLEELRVLRQRLKI